MNEKLGVQIFTVRDYMNSEEQIRESFKKLKKIGYDYIQTAGTPKVSYEMYGSLAKECGLEICGTHDNFDMMVNDPEQSVKNHKLLDTRFAGIGGKGFEGSDGTWRTLGYHNDEQLFGTIDNINRAAENLCPHGFKITYHNHAWEFAKYGDKTVLQHILDGTNSRQLSICLDVYWAQYGGADVRHTIEQLAGRLDIIHLKDMARGEKEPFMAYVGEGNLCWQGVIDSARNAGVKYFVVEQDDCQERDPFECLEKSYEYLREKIK